MLRDAVAALSLANILFLRIWGGLFAKASLPGYWSKQGAPPLELAAAGVGVLLLASLIFFVIRVVRQQEELAPKFQSKGIRAGAIVFFSVVGLAATLSLWVLFASKPDNIKNVMRVIIAGAGGVGIATFTVGYLRGSRRVLKGFLQVMSVLAPLVILCFGEAAYLALKYNPQAYLGFDLAPRLQVSPTAPHVVWIIFDEWDNDLTFLDPPKGLSTPELDRFRDESIYCDKAETPGPQTDVSMPALTMGRVVTGFQQTSISTMRLTTPQGPISWNKAPTIFSDARNAGFNTSVVAWALPYCRVFSGTLTNCFWSADDSRQRTQSLPALVADDVRRLFETEARSLFGQTRRAADHAWLYHRILGRSLEAVSAEKDNLILLHLPIPHRPYFYDSSTGKDDFMAEPFSFLKSPQRGYVEMLKLVDLTAGQIRRTMESAGVWDKTTVLISADHPDRNRSSYDGKPMGHTVPYILKLAGHHEKLVYDRPFSALVTRALLMAVLRREVSTPEEVAGWLDKHSTDFAIPQLQTRHAAATAATLH